METLLIVAVVLTALAIIVQAGILVSMYLLSRRLANKAAPLMDDSRRITGTLKTISDDLAETGKRAQQELARIQQMVAETRELVLDTVVEARGVVMRPVRQYSAFASAIAEAVRTLFGGRQTENVETEIKIQKPERPAA
jgi:3-oxoacyl-(acyl-carrier-protein) synthase